MSFRFPISKNCFPPGAAMLVAVLILTTLMLGFAIVASTTTRSSLESLTVLQNKKTAEAAAASCMDHALYALGVDEHYTGNEIITVGFATCRVLAITSVLTIETESQVAQQYARYQVNLNSRNPVQISSWKEIVQP